MATQAHPEDTTVVDLAAFEAESATPEFAHAMRGYDRYQVDDYVGRLNEWAAGAQARAEDAEARAGALAERVADLEARLADADADAQTAEPGGTRTDRAVEEASARATAALDAALAEADGLRHRAAEDAAELVERPPGVSELLSTAREERRAVLARAEARARELLAAAEASAEESRRAEAQASAEARSELDRLHDERSAIRADLARMRAALKGLLADAADSGELPNVVPPS